MSISIEEHSNRLNTWKNENPDIDDYFTKGKVVQIHPFCHHDPGYGGNDIRIIEQIIHARISRHHHQFSLEYIFYTHPIQYTWERIQGTPLECAHKK